MKVMKLQALVLLSSIALSSMPTMAQGEHLEVPESPFSSFEHGAEYDYAVRKTLLVNVTDIPYVRMLAKPSFSSEWMVHLLEPEGPSARVQLVMARAPVWNGGSPKVRRTRFLEADIPSDIAQQLRDIWLAMLRQVRYPAEPTLGYDGTTYHFTSFVLNWGNLEGEIWSPPKDTPAGQLVSIGNALRSYVETEEGKRGLIAKEIRELGRALESRLHEEGDSGGANPN